MRFLRRCVLGLYVWKENTLRFYRNSCSKQNKSIWAIQHKKFSRNQLIIMIYIVYKTSLHCPRRTFPALQCRRAPRFLWELLSVEGRCHLIYPLENCLQKLSWKKEKKQNQTNNYNSITGTKRGTVLAVARQSLFLAYNGPNTNG